MVEVLQEAFDLQGKESRLVNQFKKAYDIASAEKKQRLMDCLGSILISSGKSRSEVKTFTHSNISDKQYSKLKFYSETLGPGKLPAAFECPRNVAKKAALVSRFVNYLLTFRRCKNCQQ